jgi:hypothetical protein
LLAREHSNFSRNKQYRQLCSVPFLVALLLLLLNDFYLKAEYHNWFTGKLSDVAGLFIFPFFWTVFLPRHRLKLYGGTALLFILWKSPFSEGFIQLFSHYLYPIDRVVDVTDLLALAILPFSYWQSKQKQVPKLRINPAFIGILSFFSFCATSVPQPGQHFEQPQYVLLKNSDLELDVYGYYADPKIHRMDSLMIIEVPAISIDRSPPRADDYYKTFVQRDLILRVLRETRHIPGYRLEDYTPMADSLRVPGAVTLALPLDAYTDSLSFTDSRLHGNFSRVSPSGRELIRGQFNQGIEDSLWHYYDERGALMEKKHFREGELVRSELYDSWKPVKTTNVKTRAEVVRAKYFHLALLIVLAGGIILYLIRLPRTHGEAELFQTHIGKIGYSFLMGFIVLLLSGLISLAIPESYTYPFLAIFVKLLFGFLIVAVIFLILFYAVKIRKARVLLAYVFLFALLIVILEEGLYLKQLLADPI